MVQSELGLRREEQGIQQGLEQGIQQGNLEAKLEMVKRLLDILDDETISQTTGITIEEIRSLRERK